MAAGRLFNPRNKKQDTLSGSDAAVVGEACRAADAWLHTSQYSVGMGEYVVSMLRAESTSRSLTEIERTTLHTASVGCEELKRGWNSLGEQLTGAVKICHDEEHDQLQSGSEDCRKLWGRVLLARSRGESQTGAGVDFSKPGSPQPGCVAIQTMVYNLRRGSQ